MTEVAEPETKTKQSSAVSRWKRLGEPQQITLPSGMTVKIVVPDLPEMLREGEVPNALVKVAQETNDGVSGADELDPERIKDATDFMRWMVSTTVKDPADLTPEDVPLLPAHDREMILEFALRQRDIDAVGHQLFGLEKVSEWRRFRRQPSSD